MDRSIADVSDFFGTEFLDILEYSGYLYPIFSIFVSLSSIPVRLSYFLLNKIFTT